MRRTISAQVRTQGYAIYDEELEIGGSGVAAPVRGADGSVIAALNVATPSTRFRVKREQIIDTVQHFAQGLSRRAGHLAAGSPSSD